MKRFIVIASSIGLAFCVSRFPSWAQDNPGAFRVEVTPQTVKSLEDIRKMGDWKKSSEMMHGYEGGGFGEAGAGGGGFDGGDGYGGGEGMGMMMADESPRGKAKRDLIRYKRAFKTGKDRKAATDNLRKGLDGYFIADMRHRVVELDAIKAQVAAMEKQLEKRMASRQALVDLQLNLFLQEVAGLGFFAPGDDVLSNRNHSGGMGMGMEMMGMDEGDGN